MRLLFQTWRACAFRNSRIVDVLRSLTQHPSGIFLAYFERDESRSTCNCPYAERSPALPLASDVPSGEGTLLIKPHLKRWRIDLRYRVPHMKYDNQWRKGVCSSWVSRSMMDDIGFEMKSWSSLQLLPDLSRCRPCAKRLIQTTAKI